MAWSLINAKINYYIQLVKRNTLYKIWERKHQTKKLSMATSESISVSAAMSWPQTRMRRSFCVATQSLEPYANLYKSKTKSSASEPRQKHTEFVLQLSCLNISFVKVIFLAHTTRKFHFGISPAQVTWPFTCDLHLCNLTAQTNKTNGGGNHICTLSKFSSLLKFSSAT